ncbi:major facilitator superfamily domain-containing protein [Talaromyces proteolyticus]|uniref:Major facilitator superfamily domain-containing protein n=1 Tax=Talaromyces proteolyticus TaxID=1131652 RepID=A0AAD4L622_9EURO|nr:major facilitator superfamily domain-containing protein [Talaromyces proteolyticus]KAH8705260.1 major facilitator superfamily domain-containing protein [Talaromyces proteolyticus]
MAAVAAYNTTDCDNAKYKEERRSTVFRSSKTFIVIVVSIAIFADVFIYGMVIPLVPTILRDRLDLPDDELQKWLSILLATFGGALLISSPIVGYVADKGSSRKFTFIVGLFAVAGATVLFWVARTPTAMVTARALQGVAEVAMWVVGNALVVDTVDKEQLGTAMGYVSMSMTVGTMAGPAVAGILLNKTGYDSVFILALSLIGIDVVFRCLMIEPKPKQKVKNGETEPLLRDSGVPQYQSTTEAGHDEEACSGHVSTSFIPPIVRLALSGQLLVLLIASIINAIVWTSFETTLPVFVIRTFHWESAGIGMSFFALTIPAIISPLIGSAIDYHGPRIISSLSFISLVPIFIAFQFVTDDSLRSCIIFFSLLVAAGLALSAILLPLMVELNDPIERKEREMPGIFGEAGASAQAFALHTIAWGSGQTIGPIVAGAVVETAGWRVMNIVMAACCAATAVLLVLTDEKVLRLVWRRYAGSNRLNRTN